MIMAIILMICGLSKLEFLGTISIVIPVLY